MKRKLSHTLGVSLLLFVGLYGFLRFDTLSQTNCCPPPPLPPEVPRFPRGAQVSVYIVTTGLTAEEITALTIGITDWNNQPNNSGVTFNVTTGTNPPSFPPATHTIVASYIDQQNPNAIMDAQPFHSGNIVYFNFRVFQNIRSGWNQEVQNQVTRTSARHETGHTLGLNNAESCTPGSTIMRPSISGETFITPCDNDRINEDPVYGETPTPTPSPTPCAQLNQSCYFSSDCCAGTTCGNLSYLCISCEPNPQDNHDRCMSERCRNCYGNGGVHCTGEGFDCWTPIVVDVDGNGFDLTDADGGVYFNDGNGTLLRTAWTAPDSDDAWLVLDRNNNGIIDDGTELFGNASPQPFYDGLNNGFRALNEYDKAASGGNEDGYISSQDSVFSLLRLWQDTNHDGISSAAELHSLHRLNVASIHLEYKSWKYKDANGNTFKFRAKIKDTHGAQLGRWVYDVFLDARRAQ